jgi:8-oxo-dGTP diphosphatase
MQSHNDNFLCKNVSEINWDTWIPKERAVLCFIQENEQIMLIHKKRGLGKGKVNAPGGRIELNETPEDAAVRETEEEIGLTPANLMKRGELFFIFTDGYSLHGTIYFANQFVGSPIETDEAVPFWCSIKDIPYENMWEDDRHWLPIVLSGKFFRGYFIFDNDTMLSYKIDNVSEW